ncbi:dual specificity protein kinase Ttk isoform X1 [Drosophila obscura]|uniref:dual specificity protein kinase Ttk isoform X1 n=1 Tax=Drosophila obscura TaxID=7282 RepID=UPI001BB1110E|nr:dual specificity protein kinase Ttk isoform X1 [Drosophila obscura]
MSTPVPRRTKDLLALGIDSDTDDDYNSPLKPHRSQAAAAKNHRPAAAAASAFGQGTGIGVNAGNKENISLPNRAVGEILPRRTSEMSMMDSDSDEEEDNKNDHNLNCAILNDSFVLSPTHELPVSGGSSMPSTAGTLKQSDSNLSFLGRFGNMGINCSSTSAANQNSPAVEPEPQAIKKPPPSTLQTISERRKLFDNETPLRNGSTIVAKSQAKAEVDFITPLVRAGGSTQAPKSRSAVVSNEFRAQKVLFQTPMTVGRGAPFSCDSFSLCDTISESPDIPPRQPEPQPQPKVEPINGKSKKSLDNAFHEAEKEMVPPKIEPVKPKEIVKPAPVPPSTASKSSNILKIKNHEYVIGQKLGCGGSSSVYLARRPDSGGEFALKVVDLQADPSVVQGYLNETKLLEKLQGNVCVVALYDYQLLREESKLYMVMEKGDCDLNKILQSYTTNLPAYSLMSILYQMLQAVNYIHQHGVIHSDLKPANFLMVNGRLKLIDFGIASNISVDSTSIIKFSQAGTFNYISPEALTDTSTGNSPMRGGNQPKIKISTKSDVWSLGCILYLLMYQKTPFGHIRNICAKMNAIANPGTNIEYPDIPFYYPAMLVHMVKKCLQLNPKMRPSCTQLLQYPFHMAIPLQNLQIASKASTTTTTTNNK